MIDQTLTTPPDAPSSNDIPTFRTRFDAFIAWIVTFVSQLTTVISQINSTATTINDKESSTIASAQVAVSAVNFKGTYTTQTTQVGESYLWNGIIYLVLVAGNTSPTTSPSNWKAIGISDQIHSSSSKTTPIDADEFGIWDSISASLKKVTFVNLKSTLKTYFDTIYNIYATETTAGIIEIATNTETIAGSDNTRSVTPQGLKNALGQLNAGLSIGAVGTYAFLGKTVAGITNVGETLAGSSLRYAGIDTNSNVWNTQDVPAHRYSGSVNAPSGTWRCMGTAGSLTTTYGASLWLRIA